MSQNLILSIFEVESEAFQAMTELKASPYTEKSLIRQAVLVKKEEGSIKTMDYFDTGADSVDDFVIGGILGAFLGILGGPVGVLLGTSYGMLMGSTVDAVDSLDDTSLVEQIIGKIQEGDVAVIGLTDEEDESVLDEKLSAFKTTVIRYDAAVVAQEVDEAREAEKEMERQARRAVRKTRNDEFKGKVEEQREKLKASFEELKRVLNTPIDFNK